MLACWPELLRGHLGQEGHVTQVRRVSLEQEVDKISIIGGVDKGEFLAYRNCVV